MTAAQEYWWLAPLLSGLALAAVVWFQWGQHKVREISLRRPFVACLAYDPADGDEYCDLHLPAHRSEIMVQVRIRPRIKYRETETVFGFEGDRTKRPLPIRILNTFIKHGDGREQHPNKNTNHYIDQDDYYHIVRTVDRSPPNTQIIGFMVQTREPGRFPVYLGIITDCGEAKPHNDLLVVTVTAPIA
jgi:hypothetical protein